MASTRLPNKPLAICRRADDCASAQTRAEADCGRVVVAAAEQEIADAVIAAGGEAILTDPDLPSGSDRIHAALQNRRPAMARMTPSSIYRAICRGWIRPLVRDCLRAGRP